MNHAILLSGGTGTRINSDRPKQYIRAAEKISDSTGDDSNSSGSAGHMMITYAIASLMRSEYIDSIYIVCDEMWRDEISEDIGIADKLSGFAAPGENRQLSILNGMETILAGMGENGRTLIRSGIQAVAGNTGASQPINDDTVLIHDAARPFLTEEMLARIYEALPGHDGVMPVLPMKDTIYYSRSGKRVDELLDRGTLYAGQAPELFYLKSYYEATRALLPDRILNINGSTEPAVMAGLDVAMIPGDESNFKVTTDADLERFIEMIKENT
ncbi:MAG: 2-C-methyl-D-erythritol 4-phosphate cytidylyltransferase [Eubacterium sp.]|nr:2-C-methyl-D-erythritol 4-phosphate cytidylyltransferase [Eubacterium sp.]